MTLDAFGTLVELADPTERLAAALAKRGVRRSASDVCGAFAAEVAYYVPRSHEGRDEATLAALRRDCMAVFLSALAAEVDPGEFVPDFVAALEFRPLTGVPEALDRLRAAELALACVANWDVTLPQHLENAGLGRRLDAIVSAAEAGAPKPDPRIFEVALGRIGVGPAHAVHVGDDAVDREGARAAGLAFEPVPLATLPARLGLG